MNKGATEQLSKDVSSPKRNSGSASSRDGSTVGPQRPTPGSAPEASAPASLGGGCILWTARPRTTDKESNKRVHQNFTNSGENGQNKESNKGVHEKGSKSGGQPPQQKREKKGVPLRVLFFVLSKAQNCMTLPVVGPVTPLQFQFRCVRRFQGIPIELRPLLPECPCLKIKVTAPLAL